MKRVLIPFRHEKKVRPYAEAARAGGAEPVTASVENELSLDGFSGLLLMGGTDVNPVRYGASPQPETDQPDDQRDAAELSLITEAFTRGVPILAICRGLQILNVHQGGTLIQHLGDPARHDPDKPDHSGPAHEIAFVTNTKLGRIADSPTWQVNSRHHQAIAKLGSDLVISARDIDDSTIEGIEHTGQRFVVAVQWHPEDQTVSFPDQLRLFESFAAAL